MSPENRQLMSVSINADRNTKMSMITDVNKHYVRLNALKINYSTVETK